MVLIFSIGAALTNMFGRMIGKQRSMQSKAADSRYLPGASAAIS
jgi:hypothetical protein